jgi:hypothetical protein
MRLIDASKSLKRTLRKEKRVFEKIVKGVIQRPFQAKNSLFTQ